MKKVYKNVNVLDGTENMELKQNQMIVVEDGIIKAILNNDSSVDGEDLGGKYIIPGLINLHVHIPANGFPKKKQTDSKKLAKIVMSTALTRDIAYRLLCKPSAKTELLSGCTTIRAVGGVGHMDSRLRKEVEEGKIDGPRMIVCDQAVTIPGGHMEGSVAYGASSDADFERFVEENCKYGVDWIKIMITGGVLDAKVKGEPGEMKMSPEQVKICCDKAHSLGKKVCAHVESPTGVQVAIENGVDSIEHGALMSDETVKLIKNKDAVLVCTLSPAIPLAFYPESCGGNEIQQYNSKVLLDGIIDGTKKCLKDGVKVGLGTDVGCPFVTHYDMWRELEYAHKLLEIPREQALYLGTLANAKILGLEKETGSIEKGKSADMIILDKNPLEGFDAIRKPERIIFKGKEYKNPTVKKSLEAEELLDKYLGTL